jgi:hypothetical protein
MRCEAAFVRSEFASSRTRSSCCNLPSSTSLQSPLEQSRSDENQQHGAEHTRHGLLQLQNGEGVHCELGGEGQLVESGEGRGRGQPEVVEACGDQLRAGARKERRESNRRRGRRSILRNKGVRPGPASVRSERGDRLTLIPSLEPGVCCAPSYLVHRRGHERNEVHTPHPESVGVRGQWQRVGMQRERAMPQLEVARCHE